jgi:hypothetical protein
MHIQGNYFDPDNAEAGKTDLIFGTNESEVHLLIEDNYIEPWGHYTLRCGGVATRCDVVHNVFSNAFDGEERYMLIVQSDEPATFVCNRYANGALVNEFLDSTDLVLGADHVTDDCPDM